MGRGIFGKYDAKVGEMQPSVGFVDDGRYRMSCTVHCLVNERTQKTCNLHVNIGMELHFQILFSSTLEYFTFSYQPFGLNFIIFPVFG